MIITIENENGDQLVSKKPMPTLCDHERPLLTLDDCRECRREEVRQIWASRSELFERSALPTGVSREC